MSFHLVAALPERCTEVGGGEEHKETSKQLMPSLPTQTAYAPPTKKSLQFNSEVEVIIRYDGLPMRAWWRWGCGSSCVIVMMMMVVVIVMMVVMLMMVVV